MTNALFITGIGMGLVFVVIIVLWGLMELLVRLTVDQKKPEDAGASDEQLITQSGIRPAVDKRKIAAVAVITALQLRRQQAAVEAVRQAIAIQKTNLSGLALSNPVSNWQAVMRSIQRGGQQRMFSRTPRHVR